MRKGGKNVLKKYYLIFFMLLSTILLTACGLKDDAASLYKKEQPLKAEIIIPDFAKQDTIKVTFTQENNKVEQADYVDMEIWKQDGTVSYTREKAVEEGNGVYSITKDLSKEGLYYVKVYASNKDSVIMPQKQFIVGELTKSDLEFLQRDLSVQEENHEHHH